MKNNIGGNAKNTKFYKRKMDPKPPPPKGGGDRVFYIASWFVRNIV